MTTTTIPSYELTEADKHQIWKSAINEIVEAKKDGDITIGVLLSDVDAKVAEAHRMIEKAPAEHKELATRMASMIVAEQERRRYEIDVLWSGILV